MVSEDSDLPAYELIRRGRTESQPIQAPSEPDDEFSKPTSRLPPKPIPGRPKYSPFIVASAITISTIISLAVFISKIKGMLPHTEWNGLELEGASCDLVDTQNSSRLQSAFQINLRGAAHLSFAQAKFIDLVFDLLIGQGGRLLLAAISYVVFMDALVRSMEIMPVSYKLYTSMVFSSSSLQATWFSLKAVFTAKGWRAKTYLIWTVLSMTYVLAFPVLIESATGYLSPSSAGFNLANGTMVMADSDELVNCLSLTGGLWLGEEKNDTILKGPPVHMFSMPSQSSRVPKDDVPSSVDSSSLYYALITADPELKYIATNSTATPYAECRHPDSSDYESDYCSEMLQKHWDFTTNVTVGEKMSLIIPRGFSSIVLYIILGLQIIWTFGIFCVWLDANIASELVRNGRTIRGPFRGAADLVEAMNETLGHEYCAYSEKEIVKELEKSGDNLRYNSTLRDDNELLHVGLTTRWPARVLLSTKKLYGARATARRESVGVEDTS
ncbi:MAG: hypothetical protein Q9219_004572 [cf. Caloplaca sp. 3 TL-2023]